MSHTQLYLNQTLSVISPINLARTLYGRSGQWLKVVWQLKKTLMFAGLQEPALYSGHSFRRTGATMIVDGGGDILTLKRAGGWKSTQIAESYVDDSINDKIKMSLHYDI